MSLSINHNPATKLWPVKSKLLHDLTCIKGFRRDPKKDPTMQRNKQKKVLKNFHWRTNTRL